MFTLIAFAALAVDAPQAPQIDTQQAYQAAKAAAGRSPNDQVKLAYWCEAHGLTAERMRHLAQAVLADPNHAAARGLLGLVARQDHWMRPDAVADQVQADARLAVTLKEYDAKRSATPYTADGQQGLAHWAEERGLKDQARAHYTAVVRLDPKQEQAWRKLGYKKHDGHWATDAELATARTDAEAQQAADHKWKPLLEKWKGQLTRPAHRAEAEANLLTVTDPRAVASIGKVFGTSAADGPRVVQLLGQIDAPAASRAIAYLAVFGPTVDTRRLATETLRQRDPREYANLLVSLIQDPIKYLVKPSGGPGSPGILHIESKQANIDRRYAPPMIPIYPGDRISYDPTLGPIVIRPGMTMETSYLYVYNRYQLLNSTTPTSIDPKLVDQLTHSFHGSISQADVSKIIARAPLAHGETGGLGSEMDQAIWMSTLGNLIPVNPGTAISYTFQEEQKFSLNQMVEENQKTAFVAQQQLSADTQNLDRINAGVDQNNERVVGTLNTATGQNLKPDRDVWTRWYVDLLGYRTNASSTDDKPTIIEDVPISYQPQVPVLDTQIHVIGYQRISCFGAGTPVQTLTGPQPIEQLKVGDLVLTQSTSTGALGYQPVTVTHHNPPSPTFRINLGDDTIVASPFHRFWVARHGWVMARDLKAGDPVRTLGAVRPVDSVEPGKTELVYNLDIASDADFFAGRSATLVHDNTMPDPRLIPFDLPTGDARAVAAR